MMNERIQELAKQANARKLGWAYYRGEVRQENAVELHSVDLELFAELIVSKCVEVINAAKVGYDQVPAEVALDMAAKNVKAYFGTEE